jgi:nitroimidazol reductase NimA-like FMN-containing flavoprotein (pyridoxamine 5'-phosphate oxidase superfamily)
MTTYPQKPPFTPEELEVFLTEAPIARISTQNRDGTIHIAAVYFKYDNGDIIIGTQDMTHKVRNIKKNPQVTVLIDNQAPHWKGVLIYGRAELDYEDVVAKRTSIFERYKTPEEARKMAEDLATKFTPVIIRVKPKCMSSYDYSKPGFITT